MGEAFLLRRGGAVSGIEITRMPDRTVYGAGVGMIVCAKLGAMRVPLKMSEAQGDGGWTYSPAGELTSGTSQITVSAAIGQATWTATVPITVSTNSNFGSNSWAVIAAACAAGKVPDSWALGAKKSISFRGENWNVVIIGKNHDTLSQLDEKTGTGYNGGTGKAALTLQFENCVETAPIYESTSGVTYVDWRTTDMFTKTLPGIENDLPADLRPYLRTVVKQTYQWVWKQYDDTWQNDYATTDQRVTILSEKESRGTGRAGNGSPTDRQYAWYQQSGSTGRIPKSGAPYNEPENNPQWHSMWFRHIFPYPGTSGGHYYPSLNRFSCYHNQNGHTEAGKVTDSKWVTPVFFL